ncbi:MAG: Rrf2 family transcriptional regulator [Phycisphaerae bacterium]
MISKTAEYAVRSCLWLAEHPGQAWTVQHIAAAINVPAKYLAKVMQLLGRAKLVRAQPGPGGGFTLAQVPAQVCVLAVIDAVDPLPRIRSCPAGIPEHDLGLCPLHARLDQALASVENSFRECTLAELLRESAEQDSPERSE